MNKIHRNTSDRSAFRRRVTKRLKEDAMKRIAVSVIALLAVCAVPFIVTMTRNGNASG